MASGRPRIWNRARTAGLPRIKGTPLLGESVHSGSNQALTAENRGARTAWRPGARLALDLECQVCGAAEVGMMGGRRLEGRLSVGLVVAVGGDMGGDGRGAGRVGGGAMMRRKIPRLSARHQRLA